MTAALEGGEWSAARPGRTLTPGKTRYPLYRRLGGSLGRSGWTEYLVTTGIRSRTVQPVAQSLYWLSYPAHNVKEQNVFRSRNNVTCSTNCKYRTAATLYTLEACSFRCIIVNTLHEGDNKDVDDDNDDYDNNKIIIIMGNSFACAMNCT